VVRDDAGMKRTTAIKRLADVVDGLERAKAWPDSAVTAAYVYGDLLRGDPEFERIDLALIVDEPPEAVPWMARPRHLEALAATLRFTKLPLSWLWRPAQWPVWNHEITSAACFWTAGGGGDQTILSVLADGRVEDITVEAPADRDELVAQLAAERDVARRYLTTMTESFYNQDWRRAHRGDGIYPEDHLWWATAAYLQLDDAVRDVDR
jgi:hypothetical protein